MGKLTFKSFIVWIVILSLVIIYAALALSGYLISVSDTSQFAAMDWVSPDSTIRYAQISAFISKNEKFGFNNVMGLRLNITSKLQAASIKSEIPDTRLYIDAYSSETKLSAGNERTSVTVTAMGVGGDFFTFHPFKLKSGFYFSELDLAIDRVVIDDVLAWQLYGSYDISGLPLYINGTPYIIAGVTERDFSNKLLNTVYGDKPRLYMSYDALSILNPDPPITCYEILIPNPVTNFAFNIIKENIGLSDLTMVENSSRFSALNLYKSFGGFFSRSMRMNTVSFPYWENMAVTAQDKCVVILLFETIALSSAGLILVIYLFYLWKSSGLSFKKIVTKIENIKFPQLHKPITKITRREKKQHDKEKISK